MGKNIVWVVLIAAVLGLGVYYMVTRNSTTNTNDQNNSNVVANTSTTTNSDAHSNTNVAVATCTSSNLSASLTNGSGTAGTYYYSLAIKNTGTADCRYSGTTAIALLNAAKAKLGSTSVTTTSSFTIAPSGSIYAAVGFPAAINLDTTCKSGVTTLSVTPPAQTTALTVSGLDTLYVGWTNYACPNFSVHAFSETAQ